MLRSGYTEVSGVIAAPHYRPRAPISKRTVSGAGEPGGSGIGSADPRLATIVEQWDSLPAATREAIAALLDAAK